MEAFGPLKDWVRPKTSPSKSNVASIAEKLESKILSGRTNVGQTSVAERRGMWENKIKDATSVGSTPNSVRMESPGKAVGRSEAGAHVVQSGGKFQKILGFTFC